MKTTVAVVAGVAIVAGAGLWHSHGTTISAMPTKTPELRVELREDAIEYRGHYLPISGLRVAPAHASSGDGSGCPEPHLHVGAKVTALDGTVFVDPDQEGCGFGTLTEHPVINAVQ